MHYAAACEGPGPLEYLLKNGIDTRERDQSKNTPLMIACKYGRIKNVKLLIENELISNIDCKNKENNSAIHIATKNGHLDILKILLKASANFKLPGQLKMLVTHIASAFGHFDCLKFLVEEAKVSFIGKDKFQRSCLSLAARNGNIKITSYLLSKYII